MASLIDRLQRLEVKAAPPSGDSGASPEMDRLLDAWEEEIETKLKGDTDMTKHPRDHRTWRNTEIEEDPQGYLAAQEAQREDQSAEDARRREADDQAAFTAEFVRAGGRESDADAAYRTRKNERALDAAALADEAANRLQRSNALSRI